MTVFPVIAGLLAGVATHVSPPTPATAGSGNRRPSFSCEQAKRPVEQAICGNARAAAADAAMAARYALNRTRLSTKGRRMLLVNQRAFLARLPIACAPGYPGRSPQRDAAVCAAEHLEDRTRELSNAVQTAAGHVFLRLTTYREKRVSVDPDQTNFPPLRSRATTLVQIDRPRSEGERRWNTAMLRWIDVGIALAEPDALRFDDAESAGMTDIEIRITAASPTIVSASLGASSNWGGAHPLYVERAMLWSIPKGRSLRPAELFRNGKDPGLDRLLASSYGAGGYADHQGCEAPKALGRTPTLTRTAVTFSYDSYELGGYPCGGESVIPWRQIMPFLRPSLIVPGALATPRVL